MRRTEREKRNAELQIKLENGTISEVEKITLMLYTPDQPQIKTPKILKNELTLEQQELDDLIQERAKSGLQTVQEMLNHPYSLEQAKAQVQKLNKDSGSTPKRRRSLEK